MAEGFKVICAWCQDFIKGDLEGTQISHGCCKKCFAKQLEEAEKAKEIFKARKKKTGEGDVSEANAKRCAACTKKPGKLVTCRHCGLRMCYHFMTKLKGEEGTCSSCATMPNKGVQKKPETGFQKRKPETGLQKRRPETGSHKKPEKEQRCKKLRRRQRNLKNPHDVPNLYRNHPSVGEKIITTIKTVYGNGSEVPKGLTGKIISVEPAAKTLVYLVATDGYGERGFDKSQFRFLKISSRMDQNGRSRIKL